MKDLSVLKASRASLAKEIGRLKSELRVLFPFVQAYSVPSGKHTDAGKLVQAGKDEIYLIEMTEATTALTFEDCSEEIIVEIVDHLIRQAKLLEGPEEES